VPQVKIRPVEPRDLEWVRAELTRNWGRPQIWSINRMFDADALPGFIAEPDGGPVGLVTYSLRENVQPGECEVVTLSVQEEGRGIGHALLAATVTAAAMAGCHRIFLTTTNDNLRALGFYQRRGWVLVDLHRGVIDRLRERYPDIPSVGMNGIRCRDEIELELPKEEWP